MCVVTTGFGGGRGGGAYHICLNMLKGFDEERCDCITLDCFVVKQERIFKKRQRRECM